MFRERQASLPPILAKLPLIILEVGGDGLIRATNGQIDATVGEAVVDQPLFAYFMDLSARKLTRLLDEAGAAQEMGIVVELQLPGTRDHALRTFHLVVNPEDSSSYWLIEQPEAAQPVRMHEDLGHTNAEVLTIQRELAKKTARLSRALDEIERKLSENQSLSEQLQDRSQEVHLQQEELLTMTEELHHGQNALLQLSQQLERRTRELHLAVSARNRFYASMSHELRTPVNAVMGYNDLLLAGVYGELNEQQELAIERSQAAVRHLRELINDVLDISKIEAGKLDVTAEEVRLAELFQDLLATVQPMTEAQGSHLQVALDSAPETVCTDPRRLRQILLNLLSNAIRYGQGKPIWVRCESSPMGGVIVEVVDNGAGIAPEDLSTIFDEFTQLAGVEASGTGLGLAIARRLARLLGGDLEANSTPGVGTTFRLRLPRTPQPSPSR